MTGGRARIRPPDWLIYAGVVGALAVVALVTTRLGAPPKRSASLPESTGIPLAPPSGLDPTVAVDVSGEARGGGGTAFSVDPRGVWLTARHVVEGCARTVVIVGPGRGVAAAVRIDPAAETAILTTNGGAPALSVAPRRILMRGAIAFSPGFPRGRPGDTASRLLRRETLIVRGHGQRREPVLAWIQLRSRLFGGPRTLAGLSGAPALDSRGRVVGVTIAQSRRRRLIYVTTPPSLRAALAQAGVSPGTDGSGPITLDNYHGVGAALRHRLSVARVACLAH